MNGTRMHLEDNIPNDMAWEHGIWVISKSSQQKLKKYRECSLKQPHLYRWQNWSSDIKFLKGWLTILDGWT